MAETLESSPPAGGVTFTVYDTHAVFLEQGHNQRTREAWRHGVRAAVYGWHLIYQEANADYAAAERAGHVEGLRRREAGEVLECSECRLTSHRVPASRRVKPEFTAPNVSARLALDMDDRIHVFTMRGVEGPSLCIGDHRVAGPKAWGGGEIMNEWEVSRRELLQVVQCAPPRASDDD